MSDTPLDRALAMVWARRTLTVAELMVAFSEKENEALKKEIAELKKYLPAPEELPEPAETYMMTQYLVDGTVHKPAHCRVVANIYYDELREDSVLQITALKKEIAALEAKLRWCYDTSMFRFVTPIITYQNWLDMIQMIEGRS